METIPSYGGMLIVKDSDCVQIDIPASIVRSLSGSRDSHSDKSAKIISSSSDSGMKAASMTDE